MMKYLPNFLHYCRKSGSVVSLPLHCITTRDRILCDMSQIILTPLCVIRKQSVCGRDSFPKDHDRNLPDGYNRVYRMKRPVR